MLATAMLFWLCLAAPGGERVDFGKSTARRVRLLRHQNPRVRRHAALLLAHAEPDRAIAGLLVALRDPHPGVRRVVATVLAEYGDKRAVPFLARQVRVEKSPSVLAAALLALARCGKEYVARHVLPFLEHPVRGVRVAAAAALGNLGDAGQRDALWDALRYAPDDPQFEMRSAVLDAFVRLSWKKDVARAIDELLEAGAARHWRSRAMVLAAIGSSGLNGRVDYVRAELARREDPRVVAAAAEALARLGHRNEVLGLLEHEAAIVRRSALVALQEAGDSRVIDKAAAMVLADADRHVRFEATLVLHRAKDPRANGFLIDALRSRNPLFWITALGALEQRHRRSFGRDPDAWSAYLRRRQQKRQS